MLVGLRIQCFLFQGFDPANLDQAFIIHICVFLVPRLVGWSAGKGRDDGEWFWFLTWLNEKNDSH